MGKPGRIAGRFGRALAGSADPLLARFTSNSAKTSFVDAGGLGPRICAFIDPASGKSWYDLTSQAFAVFLPIKSVGVMRDGRTCDFVVAPRAVVTSDFMTADWAELP